MYSFFALSGSQSARCAASVAGSLIVTFFLMAPGISSSAAGVVAPVDAILSVTPNLAALDPATPEFLTTLATGAFA
ncbi:MAG: hypothetical protein AAF697_09715 [Pseudomonadota bacterium]